MGELIQRNGKYIREDFVQLPQGSTIGILIPTIIAMHTPTVLLMTLAGSTLASPLLERNAQCSDAFRSSITTGLARALSDLGP